MASAENPGPVFYTGRRAAESSAAGILRTIRLIRAAVPNAALVTPASANIRTTRHAVRSK